MPLSAQLAKLLAASLSKQTKGAQDLMSFPTGSVMKHEPTMRVLTPEQEAASYAPIRTSSYDTPESTYRLDEQVPVAPVETPIDQDFAKQLQTAIEKQGQTPAFYATMTTEELEGQVKLSRDQENKNMVTALGSQKKVDLFNKLDSQQNSSNTKLADEASEKFDIEFGDLTDEQDILVYGRFGEGPPTSDEFKGLFEARKVINDLEDREYSSDSEVSRVLIHGLLDFDLTPEKIRNLLINKKGDMRTQEGSTYVLGAFQEAKNRGLDLEDALIGALRQRGFSKDDAYEMLLPFLTYVKKQSTQLKKLSKPLERLAPIVSDRNEVPPVRTEMDDLMSPAGGKGKGGEGTNWEDTAPLEEIEKFYKLPENQRQAQTPQLKEAAQALQKGDINKQDFDEITDTFYPAKLITEMPEPPHVRRIEAVLGKKVQKRPVINKTISKELEGKKFATRLDIPSYNIYDTWVVTVHGPGKGGKALHYSKTAYLKNVTFISDPDRALKVATEGTSKNSFARMEGTWKDTKPQDAYSLALAELNKPNSEWIQVGMNPYKHSYFYDKKTMQPILSASEVIQVGPLVLARNVKRGNASDFSFEEGGVVDMRDGGKVGAAVVAASLMASGGQAIDMRDGGVVGMVEGGPVIDYVTPEEDEFNKDYDAVKQMEALLAKRQAAVDYGGLEQPNTRTFSPSEEFIDYLMSVENAGKKGYDKDTRLWHPFSPTGNVGEEKEEIFYGIVRPKGGRPLTQEEAEKQFMERIQHAAKGAERVVDKYMQPGTFKQLSQRKQEAFVDYVYNMGEGKHTKIKNKKTGKIEDERTGFTAYKKLIPALVNDDLLTVEEEYIRHSGGVPLGRNKNFRNYFPEFFVPTPRSKPTNPRQK